MPAVAESTRFASFRSRPGLAPFRPLTRHRCVEPGPIQFHAAFAERVFGEIARESKGVVEAERDVTGKRIARFHRGGRFIQQLQAAHQRFPEPGLFQLQRIGDQRFGTLELGIGFAHFRGEHRDEAIQQWVLRAQQMGMAHGSPHDPAEHITTAFVRRQNAIGDQK